MSDRQEEFGRTENISGASGHDVGPGGEQGDDIRRASRDDDGSRSDC